MVDWALKINYLSFYGIKVYNYLALLFMDCCMESYTATTTAAAAAAAAADDDDDDDDDDDNDDDAIATLFMVPHLVGARSSCKGLST